jgi:hypothetical protein
MSAEGHDYKQHHKQSTSGSAGQRPIQGNSLAQALGATPDPHIIACAYPDQAVSKQAYATLVKKSCRNSGISRIQTPTGQWLIVCVADDEPAASYSARLPWGPGIPVPLSDEVCTLLLERRRLGKQRADKIVGGKYEGRNLNLPLHASDCIGVADANPLVTQVMALNTSDQPWAASGGICGAICASQSDAAHVREIITSEAFHESWEGMLLIFGDEQSAVVAAICDTRETCEVAAETITRLAGNLDFVPDAKQVWPLWALRLKAGTSPFPISVDGTVEDALDFLKGSVSPRAKLLKPSRNQPCICGSGKKYKRCCGR